MLNKRMLIRLYSGIVLVLAGVLSGCSSSSESTGPGSGSGGNGGGASLLVVPSLDFGLLPPGLVYDSVVAISSASSDYLTITTNGVFGEAVDTNFKQPLVLTPHGYKIMHVQFFAKDTGVRTAFDTIHFQGTGGNGVAVLKMMATVNASAPPRGGGSNGGGTGGGGGGGGGGNGIVGPNSGSTFLYHFTSDTNGVSLPSGDSLYTVASNSLTYQGKTNVIKVQHQNGGIDYTHIEANGDISVYLDFGVVAAFIPGLLQPGWFTIPIGSKSEIQKTILDTSITFSGVPLQVTVKTDATDLGAGSVVVSGQSLTCEKGSMQVSIQAIAYGILPFINDVSTSTVWYSNAIKFVAERKNTDTQSSVDPQTFSSSSSTTNETFLLKSYNLK
jgi:hypothetical protein